MHSGRPSVFPDAKDCVDAFIQVINGIEPWVDSLVLYHRLGTVACFMVCSRVWQMIWLQRHRVYVSNWSHIIGVLKIYSRFFDVDRLHIPYRNRLLWLHRDIWATRFFEQPIAITVLYWFYNQIPIDLCGWLLDPHIGGTQLHVRWWYNICRDVGDLSGFLPSFTLDNRVCMPS